MVKVCIYLLVREGPEFQQRKRLVGCLSVYLILSILLNKLCCFIVTKINAEEFNLFGEAGQAYSISVNLGHPHQKVHVLIDTGSTTLAIASSAQDSSIYFDAGKSSSINKSGKQVQARYSQGMWWGQLVSDYIDFPSLNIPEVRTDIALITKSHNFFMNGSGWQGLLGLAYLPVGAWGDKVVVESWLDALERTVGKPMSFLMKLCGPQGVTNATHYGRFQMLDDETPNHNPNKTYRTPILRKRWYEVGILSIRVLTNSTNDKEINPTTDSEGIFDERMCQKLNAEKSIVDSGTTNIRVPETFFRPIVDQLKNAAQASNVLILNEFWYHGEAACWPEPQEWALPWLAVDLYSADADNQYFTLEIPSQNYMRVVKARNNTGEDGIVSEYCYKLGIEAGNREMVLGYTAMEGFEVLFNRSAGWIGFQTSSCGSNTRISGPYNASTSLKSLCNLLTPPHEIAPSIKAAQWALFAVSIIASAVLIYLLAPCIKMLLVKRSAQAPQISLSQAALVEPEVN